MWISGVIMAVLMGLCNHSFAGEERPDYTDGLVVVKNINPQTAVAIAQQIQGISHVSIKRRFITKTLRDDGHEAFKKLTPDGWKLKFRAECLVEHFAPAQFAGNNLVDALKKREAIIVLAQLSRVTRWPELEYATEDVRYLVKPEAVAQ